MAGEKVFPKDDGDILYGSEANATGIVNVVAGENLTAGKVVYIKKNDGEAYLGDTGTADDIRADGIVLNSPNADATAYVQIHGNYVTSGLTANEVYYLGANGAISTTLTAVEVGVATSTTNLYIKIVQDDKEAVGTVKAWLKTLTNTPALSAFWVECDGQTPLGDAESVYNAVNIPDLNGDKKALSGHTASGGANFGTHLHSGIEDGAHLSALSKGEFYDVVWIIKIK